MPDQSESAHTLTDAEKRLRDWLMEHPEGGEMWMIVKGGFRKSYALGRSDALSDAAHEIEHSVMPDHPNAGYRDGHAHAAWVVRSLSTSPAAEGGSDA